MRGRQVPVLLLLVLWVAAASPSASPQPPHQPQGGAEKKLDLFLERIADKADPAEKLRVIISTHTDDHGSARHVVERSGARVLDEHPLLGAVTAEVPAGRLRALARRAEVKSISVDAIVRGGQDAVGTLSSNMLLPTLGITSHSDNGKDVVVAVLDSGIVDHDQIPVSYFYDFLRGGVKTKQYDDYGHGTHVAGMIRNKDDKSDARYRSVARGARLIGMKVLAADGSGYTSTVIKALEFAIANKSSLKIDVVNLSLGHPIYESAATDPLVQAVEKAVAAGIVVVVAAGNEGMNRETGEVGYAGITSPGNAPSAISVGAVDTKNTLTRADDEVAPFSSRGPSWYDGYAKPDVVAPGRRIVSFMAKGSYLYNTYPGWAVNAATRTYMALSGTSMSSAVVSGVVADMIAANRRETGRTLTPNTIKAILQFTAIDIPGADTLTQGAGSINAAGAIALARAIDSTTPVGSWWLTTTVSPLTTLSNGEVLTWSKRLVWGDRLVWGSADDSVVWGSRLVWGTRLVWGVNVLAYDSGETLLYGDQIDWQRVTPDRLVWGVLDSKVGATAGLESRFTPIY